MLPNCDVMLNQNIVLLPWQPKNQSVTVSKNHTLYSWKTSKHGNRGVTQSLTAERKAPVTKIFAICRLITYVPTVVTHAPQQFAGQHKHHLLPVTYVSPATQAEELVTPQGPKIEHGMRHNGRMIWAVVA